MRSNNRAGAPREWDARAYHTVSEPQFEWGKRVLSTLELRGNEVVMDAGCGTGRLTTLLAERIPDGLVAAVDRSENMVRVAAETLAPFADRVLVALADLTALPFRHRLDVVFSTATFHWVQDSDALFANLLMSLTPGGRLHAQCGGEANLARIHHRAHELMQTPDFAAMFRDWQEPWRYAGSDATRRQLMQAGFVDVETNVEESPVTFANAESFAAFVSTVVLRPFLARIPDSNLRTSFVERITEAAASDDPPFELDYWRLNIRARRPRR